jgi:hypothetical protein
LLKALRPERSAALLTFSLLEYRYLRKQRKKELQRNGIVGCRRA